MKQWRFVIAAILAVAPAGMAFADWTALNGAEIEAALVGPVFVYDESGARQDFRESGRTLYTHGQPSWGYWRVEDDRYCSQWPPNDAWDCYDVSSDASGAVRFQRGQNIYIGRPVE